MMSAILTEATDNMARNDLIIDYTPTFLHHLLNRHSDQDLGTPITTLLKSVLKLKIQIPNIDLNNT